MGDDVSLYAVKVYVTAPCLLSFYKHFGEVL